MTDRPIPRQVVRVLRDVAATLDVLYRLYEIGPKATSHTAKALRQIAAEHTRAEGFLCREDADESLEVLAEDLRALSRVGLSDAKLYDDSTEP